MKRLPYLMYKMGKRKFAYRFIFLIPGLVSLWSWWRGHPLIWGIDSTFPISLSDVGQYFHFGSNGYSPVDARKFPFLMPWGLLLQAWHLLGIPWSAGIAQKIYIFSLITASGISMSALSRRLFPNLGEFSSTIAGLFFQVNLFCITTIWTSQSYLMQQYSFLPLLLYLVVITFENPSTKRLLWLSAAWTVLMSVAYITTPLVLLDWITVLFFGAMLYRTKRQKLKSVLKSLLILQSSWLVFNLFWIVPLLMNYSATFAQGISSLGGASSSAIFSLNSVDFFSAIRLEGYWGLNYLIGSSSTYPWAHWESGFVNVAAFLPIIFATIGMLDKGFNDSIVIDEEKEKTSFLAVMLIFFIFLDTGAREPLGALKIHAFMTLHLFDSFRSVFQRFTEYLIIPLALLLGLGIDVCMKAKSSVNAVKTIAKVFAIVTSLIFIVLVPMPFWSGSLFDQSGMLGSNRITIPSNYTKIAAVIASSKDEANTIVYPLGNSPTTYLNWNNGNDGYQGNQPLSLMTNKPMIDSASKGSYLSKALISSSNNPGRFCEFLNNFNIQYVVDEKDVNSRIINSVGGFFSLSLNNQNDKNCLTIVRKYSNIVLYRNDSWRPNLLYFKQNLSSSKIYAAHYSQGAFDSIYVSEIPNNAKYLVFNKPFSKNWTANGSLPTEGLGTTVYKLSSNARKVTLTCKTAIYSGVLLIFSIVMFLLLALNAFLKLNLINFWKERNDR